VAGLRGWFPNWESQRGTRIPAQAKLGRGTLESKMNVLASISLKASTTPIKENRHE